MVEHEKEERLRSIVTERSSNDAVFLLFCGCLGQTVMNLEQTADQQVAEWRLNGVREVPV
jgi:hypothetical protein